VRAKERSKKTTLGRAERVMTRNTHGSAAEVSKIFRSEAQERQPDQTLYVQNPLLERKPVEHIQHIAGNMAKFRDVAREACGRKQHPV